MTKIRSLLCSAVLASLACGGVLSPVFAEGPCMERVYAQGEKGEPDYAFDVAFDKDKAGRSFSCGPEMRASEAMKAIESFRNGVLYRDQARMDSVLAYPLTARISKTLEIDEKPEVVTIRSFRDWSKFQEERMDKNQVAMVACANLGNVSIESGRSPGFMIGTGLVWFSRYVGSPRVKVSAINLFPVDTEAFVKACIP
jgi:hypothetical protein